MAELKKERKKKLKIKINPFTNEEYIGKQLEDIQKFEKCKLSIVACQNQDHIVDYAIDIISDNKQLTSLKILIKSSNQYDLTRWKDYLNKFTQIAQLNIKLEDHALGQCLETLINLTKLKIHLQGCFKNNYTCLNMRDAYKNLPNLKHLQLQVSSNPLMLQLIDGVRYLKKLQIFFFEFMMNDNTSLLENLEQEIAQLPNLTDVSVNVTTDLENKNTQRLDSALQKIKLLQKLKVKLLIQNPVHHNEIYFDELFQISHFQNLKILNVSLQFKINLDSIVSILNEISKNPCLDNTTLKFQVNCNTSYYYFNSAFDFINEISIPLVKIPSIQELSIEFLGESLTFKRLFNLLCLLKMLKKLKNLKIACDCDPEKEVKDIDKEFLLEVAEILKQLDEFILIIDVSPYIIQNEIYKLCEQVEKIFNINLFLNQHSESSSKLVQPLHIIKNLVTLKVIRIQIKENKKVQNDFILSVKENHQITDLHLIFNKQYDDLFLQYLSCSLSKFVQLKKLQLDFIEGDHTEKGFYSLQNAFKCFSDLKYLSVTLQLYDLSINCLSILFSSFQYLKQLRKLSIQLIGNNIRSFQKLEELDNSFKLPTNLSEFSYESSELLFEFSNLKNLLKEISKQQNLSILRLMINKIKPTKEEYIDLFNLFSQLKSIKMISIPFYSIYRLLLIHLFKELPYLQKIFLNKFTFQRPFDSKPFLQRMNNNSSKQEEYILLYLQNDISVKTTKIDVQLHFQKLSTLTHLQLTIKQSKQFSEKENSQFIKILSFVENLESLKIRKINQESLTKQNFRQLGNRINQLQKLKNLSLEFTWKNNQYNKMGYNDFFFALSSQQTLVQLSLRIQDNILFQIFNFDNVGRSVSTMKNLKSFSFELLSQSLKFKMNQEILRCLFQSFQTKLNYLNWSVCDYQDEEHIQLIRNYINKLEYLQCFHLTYPVYNYEQKQYFKMKRLIQIEYLQQFYLQSYQDLDYSPQYEEEEEEDTFSDERYELTSKEHESQSIESCE